MTFVEWHACFTGRMRLQARSEVIRQEENVARIPSARHYLPEGNHVIPGLYSSP